MCEAVHGLSPPPAPTPWAPSLAQQVPFLQPCNSLPGLGELWPLLMLPFPQQPAMLDKLLFICEDPFPDCLPGFSSRVSTFLSEFWRCFSAPSVVALLACVVNFCSHLLPSGFLPPCWGFGQPGCSVNVRGT